MSETIWKIYKTTCLVNGKVYIGQSIREGSNYKYYLGSGKTILKAIKKHGIQNFIKETLITCNNQELSNEYEALYIELYSSTENGIGYNILNTSYLDMKRRSQEQSIAMMGNKRQRKNTTPEKKERTAKIKSLRFKGRIFSEETKIKMSISARNKPPTSEGTRAKISIATKGNKNPMYGKKQSLESIEKNRNSQLGSKSKMAKKAEAYDPVTGETIIKFGAVTDAQRWVVKGNVSQCLNGKCHTAGGYKWRYSN